LAPGGDEGRGTLRKATGSREQALIRGYPNCESASVYAAMAKLMQKAPRVPVRPGPAVLS